MMRRTAETGDFEASGYGYGGLRDTSVGVAVKNNDSHRETEEERRSENDNVEGTSGDDANATEHPRKRKRYNRHTPRQIQELEALFKECPHPDEKQRMELSKRLCLESRQVKFWFQNRRTQMKTQLERHQNALLRQEREKLKLEKLAIIESMRSPICPNCGGAAALGDVSLEQKQLRLENARLRDGLDRVVALVERFLGRPMGSLAGQQPLYLPGDSSLDIGVGENGLPGRHPTLTTMAGYLVPSISSAMPVLPPPPVPPVTPVVTWDGLDVAGLEDGGVGCNPEY